MGGFHMYLICFYIPSCEVSIQLTVQFVYCKAPVFAKVPQTLVLMLNLHGRVRADVLCLALCAHVNLCTHGFTPNVSSGGSRHQLDELRPACRHDY